MSHLISTLIQCLIGWLFIDKIPEWLKVSGVIAMILRIVGILIILRAILSWL